MQELRRDLNKRESLITLICVLRNILSKDLILKIHSMSIKEEKENILCSKDVEEDDGDVEDHCISKPRGELIAEKISQISFVTDISSFNKNFTTGGANILSMFLKVLINRVTSLSAKMLACIKSSTITAREIQCTIASISGQYSPQLIESAISMLTRYNSRVDSFYRETRHKREMKKEEKYTKRREQNVGKSLQETSANNEDSSEEDSSEVNNSSYPCEETILYHTSEVSISMIRGKSKVDECEEKKKRRNIAQVIDSIIQPSKVEKLIRLNLTMYQDIRLSKSASIYFTGVLCKIVTDVKDSCNKINIDQNICTEDVITFFRTNPNLRYMYFELYI